MPKLFSYNAKFATFEIWMLDEHFNYAPQHEPRVYELRVGGQTVDSFNKIYDAIRAAVKHRPGSTERDDADEQVSDYLPDWQSHVDDRMRMRVIEEYLKRAPAPSYRGIEDYRHFAYPWLMDRMELVRLMEHLAVTGQLDRLLSDFMVPSEFRRVANLAKKWREEDQQSDDGTPA